MEGKKSFLLYCDQIGLFDQLPDEQAGKLIKLIFAYVNDQNPKIEDLLLKIAFEPIKLQLKRDLKQWDAQLEQRSNSGQIGNLKRWHRDVYSRYVKNEITLTEALLIVKDRKGSHPDKSDSHPIANIADTVNDTVTVTVNVNDTITPLYIRIGEFINKVREFQILDSIETEKFIDYWTEHGEKDRKARWEKEKVFDIKKRMDRWKRNNKSNQQHGQNATDNHKSVIDEIDSSKLSQGNN